MNDWIWLLQFLAGMATYYFIASPRFRRFVVSCVVACVPQKRRVIIRQTPLVDPVRETLRELLNAPQVDARPQSTRGKIVLSEEELEKYLRANSYLKVTLVKEK